MYPAILAAFLEFSRTAFSMGSASIVLLPIAVWAAKSDIAGARGLDKVVALSNLCFALPLAVFGAEHLSAAQFIQMGVPSYVPWHLFWAYFVGVCLIAASLSISEGSVKSALQQLFVKTGVRTRSQLVRVALEEYAGTWGLSR